MDTLDDLLIKRRRGTLSDAEERRLRAGLRASRECELALLAGDAFERGGSPASGDAERLQQIVANVERRWTGLPRRRWPLRAGRAFVALPIFVAAAAAASVGGYRALGVLNEARSRASIAEQLERPAQRSEKLAEHPAPRAIEPPNQPLVPPHQPAEPPSTIPLEPPSGSAQPGPGARPEPTGLRAPVTQRSEPAAARTPAQPSAPTARSATRSFPSDMGVEAPEARAAANDSETARTLFRRANRVRHTDWLAAAATYAELIQRHPSSVEAGIAEVALGKWALAQGRSGDSLEWFRAHQRRSGSALAAEALWGEARALESVGSHAEAKRPWQRLLEEYPESPYAEVARERLRRD
jgi:TolA-binding protein